MWRSVVLVGGVLAIAAVAWSRSGSLGPGPERADQTRRGTDGAADEVGDGVPIPRLRGAPRPPRATVDGQAVRRLGPGSPATAWRRVREDLPLLADDVRALARERTVASLGALLTPSTPWRAGSEPFRLAAALADEAACDALLAVLDRYDEILIKLPLTEVRDDVVLLDAVAQAVGAAGNAAQRARFDAWVSEAKANVDDEAIRARLTSWPEGGDS